MAITPPSLYYTQQHCWNSPFFLFVSFSFSSSNTPRTPRTPLTPLPPSSIHSLALASSSIHLFSIPVVKRLKLAPPQNTSNSPDSTPWKQTYSAISSTTSQTVYIPQPQVKPTSVKDKKVALLLKIVPPSPSSLRHHLIINSSHTFHSKTKSTLLNSHLQLCHQLQPSPSNNSLHHSHPNPFLLFSCSLSSISLFPDRSISSSTTSHPLHFPSTISHSHSADNFSRNIQLASANLVRKQLLNLSEPHRPKH
ncbi:hypothetical protein PGTUg99_005378 [Puccinia graminis f. sp. tritici]|uniref:Uncharacterized protein n=1 Tax=Puccinia graminis f. sp. tritici TaxID=56615 RepID=A0A5B0LIE0_PUCGR|nr:hypothetical protein PGTUg99_005378 [Puccinia graminis f. sp. tritici]